MKKYISIIKTKISQTISSLKTGAQSDSRNTKLTMTLIIILLVNIAGVTLNARFDLTSNGTYSLSDRSKEIVGDLKENLKIKVFFSQDMPAEHQTVYRYLIDLLDEYSFHGNRHFSYEVVKADVLEKEAASYGINPVQSRELSSDQVKFRKAYMGVVLQHADLIEKIEALSNPAGLEYEITSRIMRMTSKINALLSLKKPITMTLYMDSRLKQLKMIDGISDLEQKVREAAAKSNQHNYGKIDFRTVDPSSSEDADSLVSLYGLNKLKWEGGRTGTGDMIKAGEGVVGIVLESAGKFQTIPLNASPTLFGNYVITGADRMEDRINTALGALLSVSTKVGYVTGHGEPDINDEQSREGAALLKKIMSDMYELQTINLAASEIPEDIGTLIVNGPRQPLSESELYKIDQYIMSGKTAVFFIDSFMELNMQGQQNMFGNQPQALPIDTGLEKLAAHYGARVNKDIVLDKSCAKVNMGNMIKDYPLVPVIKGDESTDRKSVITRHLKGFAFLKSSSITIDEKALAEKGITARRLINSSNDSWLMSGNINFNPFFMEPPDEKELKSYTLSVLLSGTFDSYFKGKEIPAEDDGAGEKGPDGKPAQAKKPDTMFRAQKLDTSVKSKKPEIIIVSTSEITKSGFIMDSARIVAKGASSGGDSPANAILLHNMVDYASGNYYSPEMRSKNLDYNPIKQFSDNTRLLFKIFNIVGVPLLVIAAGIFIWNRRKSRRKKIQLQYSGGAN